MERILVYLGVIISSVLVTNEIVNAATPGYRLPDTIVPTNYLLDIYTYLEEPDFMFKGNVWIKVKCLKATNTIILHAMNLTINDEKVTVDHMLTDDEIQSLNVANVRMIPENEFLVIKTVQNLKMGHVYSVQIPFEGILTEGLSGYYRSQYFDRSANKTKWLAVTQFEPTDARKAFPCFDEPAMKATFKINLAHKENLNAVTNMPLKNSTLIAGMEGWVMDEFEETVPMSTYLVAYMVSDFEKRSSALPENNVTVSIWARKDAVDQTEFAKSIGPKVLSYYEEYFDVHYPLPKQDMAAIPDFSAGAMENWGLITYRETALLFDKKTSSSSNQFSITSVVAHELAHQWFGNLVTMKWWTDLWLNEGFATYVAAIGVHHVFPEWNSLESTSLENILSVFEADALKSSHPVSVPIGKTSEISQIFDSISYKKGSSLLRMMNHFLGESVFTKGVSTYLKKHKYGNAEQDDLWSSLSEEWMKQGAYKGCSVKEIMDTWTVQTGYPLVTISRDYSTGTASLTQHRYLQIIPEGKDSVDKSCWWIPITYTLQHEANFNWTRPELWLNCGENRTVTIEGLPHDQWIVFNIDIAGLYRVQYDEMNWNMISRTLNSNNYSIIPPLDRANLMMNAMDLAWRGDIDYKMALNLIKYVKNDKSYIPWRTAYNSMFNIDRMLRRTPSYGFFQKFMADLVAPIYKSFGKLTDIPKTFEQMKHHITVMNWACRYNVGKCRTEALTLFESWKNKANPDSDNPIPSDIKKLVYNLGIKYGGVDDWNFMWQRYLMSNSGSEKSVILSALGSTREVWLLNRYLDMSIDDKSGIRKQDSFLVFSSVVRSDLGFYVARDYLLHNVKDIYHYHGEKSPRIGKYLSAFSENVVRERELQKFTEFVNDNKDLLKYARLASEQSLETALANTRWHAQHYDTILTMLSL